MKDKTIEDSAVNASSSHDAYSSPEKARLDMKERIGDIYYAGWIAKTNDDKQWLQVNLGRVMKITMIATQGGRYYYHNNPQKNYYWVTSFSLHDPEDFHEQNNKVRT